MEGRGVVVEEVVLVVEGWDDIVGVWVGWLVGGWLFGEKSEYWMVVW